jgi:hypothetical protein
LSGELDLKIFIEAAYGDYEKVRGEKPDLEILSRTMPTFPRKLRWLGFLF